ncbi:hypothetical protein NKG05_17780 [Oerskovia sp. M15]
MTLSARGARRRRAVRREALHPPGARARGERRGAPGRRPARRPGRRAGRRAAGDGPGACTSTYPAPRTGPAADRDDRRAARGRPGRARGSRGDEAHLDVETYTWAVLPPGSPAFPVGESVTVDADHGHPRPDGASHSADGASPSADGAAVAADAAVAVEPLVAGIAAELRWATEHLLTSDDAPRPRTRPRERPATSGVPA